MRLDVGLETVDVGQETSAWDERVCSFGEDHRPLQVGFDGSDEAIQSIHQGALKATSLQPLATMAVSSAEMADAWIREGTLPEVEKNAIDMVLLTPNEACGYYQYAPVDPATNTNCPAE